MQCVTRSINNMTAFLQQKGLIQKSKMVYRGAGKYAPATTKDDSDDEQLYSKDLFMNVSEDDEEEKIVIINTKTNEQRQRSQEKSQLPLKNPIKPFRGLLDAIPSESSEDDELIP